MQFAKKLLPEFDGPDIRNPWYGEIPKDEKCYLFVNGLIIYSVTSSSTLSIPPKCFIW